MQDLKSAALAYFESHGLPTRKLERWKYTDLARKLKAEQIMSLGPDDISEPELSASIFGDDSGKNLDTGLIDDLGLISSAGKAVRLYFCSGVWLESLLDIKSLPNGVKIRSLADAVNNNSNIAAKSYADLDYKNEPMRALNQAMAGSGVEIVIEDGVSCDEVFEFIYLDSFVPKQDAEQSSVLAVSSYRNIISVGSGSKIKVSEVVNILESENGEFDNASMSCVLNNIVTQVRLSKNAYCDYLNYALPGRDKKLPKVFLTHYLDVLVDEESKFTALNCDFRDGINRFDIDVKLSGDKSSCYLNGIYGLKNKTHNDHHVNVQHIGDDTYSDVCYYGVLADKSCGVFDASLIAKPGVKKIDAKQANHNLLLNIGPTINTKPQLQIDTDDIKCSHGATVGQLDENALFYLLARGINEVTARQMLVQAFLTKPILSAEFSCWQEYVAGLLLNYLDI